MHHILGILGINGDEEALYRYLVVNGPVGVTDPRLSGAETAIAALRGKGMIRGDDVLFASNPRLALLGPMLEHKHSAARAEQTLAELEALFQGNTRLRRTDGPVEVMDDDELIRQSFCRLHDLAHAEVLSFLTVPYKIIAPEGVDNPHSARCRIIAEKEVFQDPDALAGLQLSHAAGCEIRMIDRLPHKLLISDRQQAMVPMVAGEPAPVLMVQPGPLMDALVTVFHTCWAQALPVKSAWRNNGSDTSRPSEQEITILRHLVRGATETQIGTALGMSQRTVIRRIQQLMERAGVETRFQLGVHAVRSGWLAQVLD